MNNFLLNFLFVITIVSCKTENKEDGFTIIGSAKGLPDNTQILLNINNKNIDSTFVQDEKFTFHGKVEEPTNAVINVNNTTNYKYLWLENTIINFSAKNGDFKKGEISGSKIQLDEEELQLKLAPMWQRNDSLYSILIKMDEEVENRSEVMADYHNTFDQIAIINQEFIKEKPNSPVSLNLINSNKMTWGKDKTTQLFALTNEESQNSKYGNSISTYLELYGNPRVGEKYINFGQKNTNEEMVKVSDILGEYTLIEFWASWCAPCRKSNPELVKLYNDYNNLGFEIIGVSLDNDKTSWVNAIEKDNLIWENVSDLKGDENEGALRYGVHGIPDNILIDKNGIIVKRQIKPQDIREIFEEN